MHRLNFLLFVVAGAAVDSVVGPTVVDSYEVTLVFNCLSQL